MADFSDTPTAQFDVVVIGAGVSGLYFTQVARKRGWSVRCYEAGSSVGGTWYWNRYPGCRVDIESLEYSYGFSEELQQEWEWTERYASQPELERYLNHVADRFGLRPHIRFDTRVSAAHFDETCSRWDVRTDRGDAVSARYLIVATGAFSEPAQPRFEGLERFRGQVLRTSRWPREQPQLAGRRVGVIGTGASGVQVIQTLAPAVKQLTVFQRTAAYSAPLQNRPMDPEVQRSIKARYAELREAQAASFAGITLLHAQIDPPATRSALEVSAEEREREFERRWASGGLCMYNAFTDLLIDEKANATVENFLRRKLRARVKKPGVADTLTPSGYPALTRRLAGDTGYCETYDRDNVELVDLRAEPIRHFTESGIKVGEREVPLDVVIFATGFDMGTGAISRIDLRGRGGRSLREDWAQGLRTYLSLMYEGFPNLFSIAGAGCPFFNPMQLCEYQGNWVARCIERLEKRGAPTVEPTNHAVEQWTQIYDTITNMTLFPKGHNYYMGDNIEGKPRRSVFFWGGFPLYTQQCEAALESEAGFRFGARVERAS